MMRLLERHGWSVVRRGKHPIDGKPGVNVTIPVPDHGKKTLAPGTQKSILRAAGLTEADLS
jgi:predicted RNA binding protein YcfA (HicA-like mRNA interferase family)